MDDDTNDAGCTTEWTRPSADTLRARGPDDLTCASTLTEDAEPAAGVYFLFDNAGALVYVGQSANIFQRLRAHRGHIPFASAKFFTIDGPDQWIFNMAVEWTYIISLYPAYNRSRAMYDPATQDPMCDAVQRLWAGVPVLHEIPVKPFIPPAEPMADPLPSMALEVVQFFQ